MHVVIRATQSDHLVMRNMHHAQQLTPSAVAHQRANTRGRARHAQINTDLVDHRLRVVRQYVSC